MATEAISGGRNCLQTESAYVVAEAILRKYLTLPIPWSQVDNCSLLQPLTLNRSDLQFVHHLAT